jgi:hypothetical protein
MEEEEHSSLPRSLWLEASAFDTTSRALLTPGGVGNSTTSTAGAAVEAGAAAAAATSAVDASAAAADVATAVPRRNVMRALQLHVAALGPPHTLVLTGVEGSGKSTALATLVASMRAFEAGAEGEADDAPFVLTHTFADPSFSQVRLALPGGDRRVTWNDRLSSSGVLTAK